MFSSSIPQFDFTIWNNNYCGEDFDLDGFDYMNPSGVAGPSQIYTGTDVLGDLDSYPDFLDFLSPSTTPSCLDQLNALYPDEGKSCPTFR